VFTTWAISTFLVDGVVLYLGIVMAVDTSVSKSVDVVSDVRDIHTPEDSDNDSNNGKKAPPLAAKLCAVLLISCISFGSHWSSGVTGAMKSTIKKVRR
jgi:hypothetical protein